LTLLQGVRHCGYPDRLLFPKGKQDSMPFSLFVILQDFDHKPAITRRLALPVPKWGNGDSKWLFLPTFTVLKLCSYFSSSLRPSFTVPPYPALPH
jgi:hypothetical protein